MLPPAPEPPAPSRVARHRRQRWSAAAVGAALGVPRVGLWLLAILAWLIVTAIFVVVAVIFFVAWAADHGLLPENAPTR